MDALYRVPSRTTSRNTGKGQIAVWMRLCKVPYLTPAVLMNYSRPALQAFSWGSLLVVALRRAARLRQCVTKSHFTVPYADVLSKEMLFESEKMNGRKHSRY